MLEQTINSAFDDDEGQREDDFANDFLSEDEQLPAMNFDRDEFDSFDEAFNDDSVSEPLPEQPESPFTEPTESKPLFPDEPDMLDPIDTQHLTRGYLDKVRKDQGLNQVFYQSDDEDDDLNGFNQFDDNDLQEL